MNVSAVIARIQTECPEITTVGGAAKLMAAMSQPPSGISAWVIPTSERAEANGIHSGVAQRVTAGVAVLLMLRADPADDTGALVYDALVPVRDSLNAALSGFVPFVGADPMIYVGGEIYEIHAGALMWQDDFETAYYRRSTP